MKKKIILSTLMAMLIIAPSFAMAAQGNGQANRSENGRNNGNKIGAGIHLNIDEETRDEVLKLKESFLKGDLTKEEFQEKLKEIHPDGFVFKGRVKPELTEEMKENFETWKEAILEYQSDDISFEELKKVHEDLFPDKDVDFDKMEEMMELKKDYANGDITLDEFKEAAKDLRPAIGNRPHIGQGMNDGKGQNLGKGKFQGMGQGLGQGKGQGLNNGFLKVDEATKSELTDLHTKYRSGDLTREEFREAVESLIK